MKMKMTMQYSPSSKRISHLSFLLLLLIFFSIPLRLHVFSNILAMNSSDDIVFDIPNILRVYKDGQFERLPGTDFVAPSVDPKTGVSSKDVEIVPNTGASARLYLPKLSTESSNKKFPILVHFHGGGFIIETPFTSSCHSYLNSIVAEANVIAVSVHYRRAPEHPLPAAYDDAWAVLQWVAASHASGTGTEAWLKDHGNFSRVFISGDSSGGNIVHNVLMRAGKEELGHGVSIYGGVLIQPYFWSEEASKKTKDAATKARMELIWLLACPSSTSLDDPWLDPTAVGASSLEGLGCERILVCIAEKDAARDGGWLYYRALGSSGWEGQAEMLETEGEDHEFHMANPSSEKAVALRKRVAAFLNR